MSVGRPNSVAAVGSSVLGEQLFGELGRIVGAKHVRTSAGVLAAYARDATPLFQSLPDVVAAPANADEVAAVLRLATTRWIPVVPRGAGSTCAVAGYDLTRLLTGFEGR